MRRWGLPYASRRMPRQPLKTAVTSPATYREPSVRCTSVIRVPSRLVNVCALADGHAHGQLRGAMLHSMDSSGPIGFSNFTRCTARCCAVPELISASNSAGSMRPGSLEAAVR